MADLPSDRLKEEPPFSYCEVVIFGPFHIKEHQNLLKHYGVLFTCLESCTVHIEMTEYEDKLFILALRHFIARRGNVRTIRCDNWSNFVGGKIYGGDESQQNLEVHVQSECRLDCVEKKFTLSHMGRVWDRQIKSARNILSSLLRTHSRSLDEESLNTLFTEVKATFTSRPLVVENINDANSEVALSPSHLLTMKSKVVTPPPDVFGTPDLYCKKCWKQVQHISNKF